MDILKSTLRPGQSYAMKPSVLAELIAERGISTPAILHQVCETWWTDGVLFRADFYPPGWATGSPWETPNNEATETLHITCRSVPSDERQDAQAFLHASVLPAFAEWILSIERLPDNSTVRREKQSFTRSWTPPSTAADVR